MGHRAEAIHIYGVGIPWGQRPSSGAGVPVSLPFNITKIFVVPQRITIRTEVNLSVAITPILVAPQPMNLTTGVGLRVGTLDVLAFPTIIGLRTGIGLKVGTTFILVRPQPLLNFSTGDDPVYIWHAPDKQCDPRALSRDIIVLQPYEEVWVAFDFGAVLDNNNSGIASVVYVDDRNSDYYMDPPGTVIDGTLVKFRLSIPQDEEEVEIRLEVAIMDSKNNRHVVDGLLRIRE